MAIWPLYLPPPQWPIFCTCASIEIFWELYSQGTSGLSNFLYFFHSRLIWWLFCSTLPPVSSLSTWHPSWRPPWRRGSRSGTTRSCCGGWCIPSTFRFRRSESASSRRRSPSLKWTRARCAWRSSGTREPWSDSRTEELFIILVKKRPWWSREVFSFQRLWNFV